MRPLLGSGILVFLIFNLDNFLIGSILGSVQLGYYALAFTWGSFICGLLSGTVNSVLFPAFSAIQNDTAAMRRWYLKTVDLVAFLSLIVNTTLLANAHFFLVTFLGNGSDKWVPATSSLEILCIYGIIRATTEPLGNCIMALGRTRILLQANILGGLIEVVLLALVVKSGKIELVAAVVLFAYVSQLVMVRSIFAPPSRDQGTRPRYATMAGHSSTVSRLRSDLIGAGVAWGIPGNPCGEGIVHGAGGCVRPWTLHTFSLFPRSERYDIGKLFPCAGITVQRAPSNPSVRA